MDIRLDSGQVFPASVRSGWWGAWWPGPEGGLPDDSFTVVVHSGGRSTSCRPAQLPN